MKNKYLIYLGIMGMLTPLSILLWIWRVISVEALESLVPQPMKLLTLIGGILISLAFASLTIYFMVKSRKECQVCGMEMERQIIQAEKLTTVGQLAGGVAHEVNTPAAIISGRVETILLNPKQLSEEVCEDLRVIQNQAERISQITRGLLLFARQAPAEKTKIDLNEIVRESINLLRSQLKKEKIEVNLNLLDEPPIFLQGQQNHLIQVLLNLLTNARDAMPNGGNIEVSTEISNSRKPMALLKVRDSGAGIVPENINKIFNPFFTTKKTGTGLGLSVAYGIIQEHGGNIEVESKVGQGTIFSVYLPLENFKRVI